ncbi:GNAT family N-acetyltransferase [Marinospirillum sp.]|uniref:GNAT family N-acetyltransferase n=1 Tax=Marinospirillum sp. TaxID=2183934 RepID=UPI003A838CB3
MDTTRSSRTAQLTLRQGSWEQLGDLCQPLRQQVFVEEQQIAASDEWDDQDALCEHFILLLGGRPIATGRLSPEGKIGRLAVVQALRGKGLGAKIIEQMISSARRQGRQKVYLHAQTHALPFYLKLGFSAEGPVFDEAGIEHQRCVLALHSPVTSLPPATSETPLTSEIETRRTCDADFLASALAKTQEIHLRGPLALQQALDGLIPQCRRSFALSTPVYQSTWLNDTHLSQLLSLARRHPHSQVQFLLGESHSFTRDPSPLLSFYPRVSSQLAIRQAHPLYKNSQANIWIFDQRHLLVNPLNDPELTLLYTQEHRRCLQLSQEFKLHWQKSERIKALQMQPI